MPEPNPDAFAFLATRRSCPAKTLRPPVPDRARLRALLERAVRVPDHGKLEPWRFVVLDRARLDAIAQGIDAAGERLGQPEDKIAKQRRHFEEAHLVVAVVASPKPSDKIPQIEQTYSAGAVCLSLVNAALADGWGANWLTGWCSHDPRWCRENLGLAPQESVAGLIHIGTETLAPPERPRPEIDAITTWP